MYAYGQSGRNIMYPVLALQGKAVSYIMFMLVYAPAMFILANALEYEYIK